ncbi:hypothetical protein [Leptolyngbya sp. FACHB-1515]
MPHLRPLGRSEIASTQETSQLQVNKLDGLFDSTRSRLFETSELQEDGLT